MTTTMTLLYPLPAEGAAPFDLDYYLKTHIPLAWNAWSKYGVTKWQVIKLAPETGYAVQSIMFWDSAEGIGKAMKEAGAIVMGDLHNFSTVKPIVLQGPVIGQN